MEWAKARPHPEIARKTIWEVFEAERPSLMPYRGPFDGFHAIPAAVSRTCLVRFDNTKCSVDASAVGRPVAIRAHAERIEIRQEGRVVAEHARAFGCGGTAYDPRHYAPVFARKPGALRNGAPFKDWALPTPIERIRRKLKTATDGDRKTVEILGAALTDGLPAVEAACASAIEPPLSNGQTEGQICRLKTLKRQIGGRANRSAQGEDDAGCVTPAPRTRQAQNSTPIDSLMLETNDEWAVARRNMSLETLARARNTPNVRLPAMAA